MGDPTLAKQGAAGMNSEADSKGATGISQSQSVRLEKMSENIESNLSSNTMMSTKPWH